MLSNYSNIEVLSVLRIFKIAINSFKVIVPILLIVTLIIDYKKAMKSREIDIIERMRAASVSKILAAILIFLIPTFVQIIILDSQNDSTYKIYLENATIENIKNAYNEKIAEYIKIAREKKTIESYQDAKTLLAKISDLEKKSEYEDKLKEIKMAIDIKKTIEKVKESKKESEYKKVLESLKKINDRELKKELEDELEKVSFTMIKYVDEYSSNGNYIENTLNLPYYDQCDLRWKNIKYDVSMETICTSASGYTSFSMIAAGYNKDMTITPASIISKMRDIDLNKNELSKKRNASTTLDELINLKVLDYYNLKAKLIKNENNENFKQEIIKELNIGNAVIILVPGHYMVLTSSKDGNVILLDPISTWNDDNKKSGKTTVDKVWQAYGGIIKAISYEKK